LAFRAHASRNSSSVACPFDAKAVSTWNEPASGSSKTSTRGARAASREATRASGFTCCAGSGLATMLRMIVHHETITTKETSVVTYLPGPPTARPAFDAGLGTVAIVGNGPQWQNSKHLNDRELSLLVTVCLEEAKRRGTLAPRHQTNTRRQSVSILRHQANLCPGGKSKWEDLLDARIRERRSCSV
jgi:hypothetical protein